MYYVTEEDIISHKRKYDLKVCYNGVQTVPGTCSYHCFIPDGDSLIMKRITSNTINDVHKFNDPKLLWNPISINQESTLHVIMTRFGTLE